MEEAWGLSNAAQEQCRFKASYPNGNGRDARGDTDVRWPTRHVRVVLTSCSDVTSLRTFEKMGSVFGSSRAPEGDEMGSPAVGSPKAAGSSVAPAAKASPKTAPKASKTDATLATATPGTGRARREAKRQQLEADAEHDADVANYGVSLEVLPDGKTRAVYAHRQSRPGDVDAWIGLHEVLSAQEAKEADDIRYEVGGRTLSARYRFKGIRSTKLEGDITFPLSAEKLSDGEYVLALHHNGGATGDENLFLAVSESFTVSDGKLARDRKRQKK